MIYEELPTDKLRQTVKMERYQRYIVYGKKGCRDSEIGALRASGGVLGVFSRQDEVEPHSKKVFSLICV